MSNYYCLPFSSHPLREELYDELHARPFRAISTPQQFSHLAFKTTPQELSRAFELVCELCHRFAVEPPDASIVSFWQDCGPFTLRWERHMEFYALTLSRKGRRALFEERVLDQAPEDWLASLPGQAVVALHLEVVTEETDLSSSTLTEAFENQQLVLSQSKASKALICSAFRLHSDGFGRILIQNREMDECRMGRRPAAHPGQPDPAGAEQGPAGDHEPPQQSAVPAAGNSRRAVRSSHQLLSDQLRSQRPAAGNLETGKKLCSPAWYRWY